MSARHFEEAPGLCENPDAATGGFRLNHTMLRVKDPARSLDFYTRVLGMRLLRRLDFEAMTFTLYFLGFVDEAEAEAVPADDGARSEWLFRQKAILELTHNWGTEDDADVAYHDGNAEPQGFGHIAITVPDVYAACERFDDLGVEFVKRPDDGKMKGIAFIRDPDGYWIEVVQADLMT
ncbi:lactoylglutathione lyase [Salinisphaera sp. PC39]|uniref:lactoylglutathione lyase n=1 Tax=Salinisphaera sp. PC39 TaxID=1304156 RepID=UPI0033409C37